MRDRRAINRLQFGSALGISVGLILTLSLYTGVLGRAPLRLSDLLYQPHNPSGQVVLVAIDDVSLKEIGALPWRRATVAQLVNTVAQAKPRVIGFDLMLADPTNDDVQLAQALAQAPQVVLPVIGVDVTRLPAESNSFPRFGVVLKPTTTLVTPNTQLGYSMFPADSDGILRRASIAIQEGERNYAPLGITALELVQGTRLERTIQEDRVSMGTGFLSVDGEGRMLINFFNLTSVRLSAAAVLNGSANLAQLQDKIVLIGPSGTATAQSYQTPISGQRLSSTEIQANLIETLLSHRTLVEQDLLTQVVMILLLAILAGATLPHFRILTAAGLVIIYFLLYLGYAFAMFDRGILVQPFYPVVALLLVLVGSAIYRYFSEERHRDFITTLLRRYVAPDDALQLTEDLNYKLLPFGGTRRQVSVLALDLSDLEVLADSLTPPALISLLDQYVSLAVAIIFQFDGAIVKHTGSAILAAWNLWTDQPDHAQVAVRTAVEIKHELAEFNRKQPKELTIHSGIGVATGDIVAGRIGARHRAEYAIIGEVVGMAERIALKPERSVFIDVTTRERIGDDFDLMQVRPVRLRRKTDPANVWQLVETSESNGEIVNESEPEIASAASAASEKISPP